jgi:Protein of unknown function (DUF4199)
MNTLDTPTAPVSNTPIWNTVLRYGAYCGGAMILFSVLAYLADLNMMSISGMLILYGSIFILGFVLAAMAMRFQRDKLDNGLISYGKALSVGLLVILIGMIISSFWNYLFVNFIDTEYLNRMKEQFVASWGENMPQDALDKALEGFDKAGNFFETLKSSLIGGTIFGLIIGLITAAFMKREAKPEYMR